MARQRILKNLIDLSTGTFVSRILGFVRELVTAAIYGTGKAMDLFVIAFTIPAFFRHFLGEDVVERAFMPPFKSLVSQGKHKQAWRLLSSCLNIMVIALIIIGPSKLPDLARALGKGMSEFKKASQDLKDSLDLDQDLKEMKEDLVDSVSDVGQSINFETPDVTREEEPKYENLDEMLDEYKKTDGGSGPVAGEAPLKESEEEKNKDDA